MFSLSLDPAPVQFDSKPGTSGQRNAPIRARANPGQTRKGEVRNGQGQFEHWRAGRQLHHQQVRGLSRQVAKGL